MIELTNIYTSD